MSGTEAVGAEEHAHPKEEEQGRHTETVARLACQLLAKKRVDRIRRKSSICIGVVLLRFRRR